MYADGKKGKKTVKNIEVGYLTALSLPKKGSAGKTGSWRVFKPILNDEKCNKCQICWILCPEACITPEIQIDMDYCKGCGVCAEECPRKAIVMEKEV